MLNPRDSGAYISAYARHVRVNQSGVEAVAKVVVDAVKDDTFAKAGWASASDLHPVASNPKDKKSANWCLFANTINFSFWSDDEDLKLFTVTYKGNTYNGWYACCALINRALDNGIPFTDAEYLCRLTLEEAKCVFTGDDCSIMPMWMERRINLIESAEVLAQKFDGDFTRCVEQAGTDAQKLLRIIVDNFPSFNDVAVYNGKTVSFLKRAQVLVSDVFACLQIGSGLDALTMFADYRVPQVLTYFGALEYSLELKDLLRKRHIFPNGSEMEVEIRGCSIHAVEMIVKTAKEILRGNEKAKVIPTDRSCSRNSQKRTACPVSSS